MGNSDHGTSEMRVGGDDAMGARQITGKTQDHSRKENLFETGDSALKQDGTSHDQIREGGGAYFFLAYLKIACTGENHVLKIKLFSESEESLLRKSKRDYFFLYLNSHSKQSTTSKFTWIFEDYMAQTCCA